MLLAVLSMGCQTMRRVHLVENPDESSRPERMIVHLRTGENFEVRNPRIRGDSLYGSAVGAAMAMPVAVASIRKAEAPRVSAAGTILVVLGLAILAAIVIEALQPPCENCIEIF